MKKTGSKTRKNTKVIAKNDPFGGNFSYTYGNDIEFHLLDVKTGKFVSAIPVLKHDKHNPIDLGDGIMLYYDNILVETSFPPYNNKQEMFERLTTVMQRIQKYIGPNYRIVPQAAHLYDDSELVDPIAKEIGCSPNFDAYTVSINKTDGFPSNYRTTGFHCHLGNKGLTDFETRLDTIKLMDIFVGLPAVIYNDDPTEIERRKVYGKAGEHRPTDFGLEFRPLSSAVLRSKGMIDLNFDLINYTLRQVEQGNAKNILNAVNSDDVKSAISKCDKKLAKSILQKVNFPAELMQRAEQVFDTNDFYQSWGIKI